MNCPNCGTINADNSIYCKKCGFELGSGFNGLLNKAKKECHKCKTQLESKNTFCPKCGEPFYTAVFNKQYICSQGNCPQCSKKVDINSEYCPNCGFYLKEPQQEKIKKFIDILTGLLILFSFLLGCYFFGIRDLKKALTAFLVFPTSLITSCMEASIDKEELKVKVFRPVGIIIDIICLFVLLYLLFW